MVGGNGEDHSAPAAGRFVPTQSFTARDPESLGQRPFLLALCPPLSELNGVTIRSSWKRQDDRQSTSGRVLKTKVAAELLHESRRHAEPKVDALLVRGESLAIVEDRRSLGHRDTGAPIDDQEFDGVTGDTRRDSYGTITGTKPTGVLDDDGDRSFAQHGVRQERREVTGNVNIERSRARINRR